MKIKTLFFILILHNAYTHAQSPDSSIMHAMETAINKGVYPNIHCILIARDGKLVYEKYWAGNDFKYVQDVLAEPHGKDSLHGVRSITKSVVSACIGIAIEQGKIKSVQQKIFEFFPEYATQDTGLKAGITIKDLLTMTAGFQWNEDDYTNPSNSDNQMTISRDPIGYVLSRPMTSVPGKTFNYCGGAPQLLCAILQKTTGKEIDSFANEFLFSPLGISDFRWMRMDSSGIIFGSTALYLRPVDLLKIGLLYLNHGQWKTNQIIPAAWVKESEYPFITADDGSDIRFGKSKYGYLIWDLPDTIENKPINIHAFIGNGGQRVFIDEEHKLVVVFNGGNYNNHNIYLNPYEMLKKYIYPAVLK